MDDISHLRTEKGRAVVRTLHATELLDAGTARREALSNADVQLDRIARLLPAALAGGLTLTEIARVTGVSRPTLYELRGRYSESHQDVRLALLQTLATNGGLSDSELNRRLRGPRKPLGELLESLRTQGFVDLDVEEDEDGRPFPVYFLTSQGLDLLEHWAFDEQDPEQGGER